MSKATNCPSCGRLLEHLSIEGLCPACLFSSALGEETSDAAFAALQLEPLSLSAGAQPFGRYALLHVLGRGGMGIVYRARERTTGREVALKIATPHLVAQGDFRHRFLAEMRVAASLDHPHILPVFEVGEHDGIPFFTMKLAEGGSLAAQLGAYVGRPGQVAALVARIARAIEHAHNRGVLHRDIKPANILLGADRHPYVADFGLAKTFGTPGTGPASTVAVGAPGYVAPEQVLVRADRPVGPTADVFSLGVVLYELLCGSRPFAATTLGETLGRMESGSYPRLGDRSPAVPRDLETICHKCLEGDPSGRYASAALLADDLESFLGGRAIRARPTGPWGRTWKWARRNPWVAGLAAGLLVALTAGATTSTIAAMRLARARDRAAQAETEARHRLWHSLLSEARALRHTSEVGHRRRALAALQQAAEIRFTPELRDEAVQALALTDLHPIAEWTSDIPFGHFSSDQRHYAMQTSANVCELRRSSDHATIARVGPLRAPVFACWRFSRDDEVLSIIGKGGEAWLWHWRENRIVAIPYPLATPPVCLEFSPDGAHVAAPGAKGGVALFDLEGQLQQTLAQEIQRPWAFAFSPDGSEMAITSRDSADVVIVDLHSGQPTARFAHSEGTAASCVAYSPDGHIIAVGTTDAAITLWSIPDATPRVLRGHSRLCEVLCFAPDGRMLASSGYDQTIRFWDVSTLQTLLVVPAANPTLQFDPAGAHLAISTEDARWAILEVARNRVRIDLAPATHPEDRNSISLGLHPSGRWLAVGGSGGARFYDLHSYREIGYSPTGSSERVDLAFATTGELYATVDDRRLVRWDNFRVDATHPEPSPGTSPETLSSGVLRLAGVDTPRGRIALVNPGKGQLELVVLPPGPAAPRLLSHPSVRQVIFDPKGGWLTAGGWKSPRASVFPTGEGESRIDLPDSDNATFAVADGGNLLLVGTPESYRVFHTLDWSERYTWPRSGSPLVTSYVAAAAEGSLGACQTDFNVLRLLDMQNGTWLATLTISITTGLDQIAISRNGETLAVLGEGHAVQVWNLRHLNEELHGVGLGWPPAAQAPPPGRITPSEPPP